MKLLFSLLIALLPIFAHASLPWKVLITCNGDSGEAVLDDYSFSTHGRMIFQQQLVIRTREINEYLARMNLLGSEHTINYPNETIIPLYRSADDFDKVPNALNSEFGTLVYRLEVELPELRLRILSKNTRGEIGNWIFRDCKKNR